MPAQSGSTTARGRSPAITAIVAGALALSAASAVAQPIPTGEAVIHSMHERLTNTWYRTLTFTQKTTLRSEADTMVVETWKEKAMLPGRLRIDMERASGPMTILFAHDSTYVMRGDSIQRSPGGNYLLTIGFDVYTQPAERTLAQLAAENFPMSPVHGDVWEGRPVWVIGAAAGDLHSKQLWIDQDRLLFVRALSPAGKDSTKTADTRFEDYAHLPDGGWLSKKVEFFVDGKLNQREEYSNIQKDIKLDRKLFVPPAG
jgi:outer membrane lipoprotein-sorting protein